jgi:hypothetical protein
MNPTPIIVGRTERWRDWIADIGKLARIEPAFVPDDKKPAWTVSRAAPGRFANVAEFSAMPEAGSKVLDRRGCRARSVASAALRDADAHRHGHHAHEGHSGATLWPRSLARTGISAASSRAQTEFVIVNGDPLRHRRGEERPR